MRAAKWDRPSPPAPPQGPRRRRAAGFTLAEIIIVVLVLAVLVTVALTILYQSRTQQERISAHLTPAQDARLAVARMCREIREGYRIFYPGPGGRSQPGVGFVNAEGAAVFYYIEAPSTATAGPNDPLYDLQRRDVNAGTTEVVARNIRQFRVTVPAVTPGREPALVHLHLTASTGPTGRIRDHATHDYATSVFLRAAESQCTEWGPVR